MSALINNYNCIQKYYVCKINRRQIRELAKEFMQYRHAPYSRCVNPIPN